MICKYNVRLLHAIYTASALIFLLTRGIYGIYGAVCTHISIYLYR